MWVRVSPCCVRGLWGHGTGRVMGCARRCAERHSSRVCRGASGDKVNTLRLVCRRRFGFTAPESLPTRQRIRAFSDEVDTGSSKKMRPYKRLEHRSDSIGSKSAQDQVLALAGLNPPPLNLRCGCARFRHQVNRRAGRLAANTVPKLSALTV